ncbi:MAG: NAD(P)(+) transhydrogenase (Re/Si-specific) subunit beta [Planctomycetes bacterium]|nr:NAD(P)(+) transhydrogenase (Re/Si-specific) subunit beta [Planctomycetota bacterium]MBI3834736.1 NAD(P)(+) transhydrogenase (Re/Si-specific) subunit beta [Planctomycetota bacterium]
MNPGDPHHALFENLTQFTYLVATALFIFSLKWLSSPKTARRGVAAGVLAMTAAIVGTLLHEEIRRAVGEYGFFDAFKWIGIAIIAGTIVGIPLAMVPLTAVPQRTALSHAFGGLAAGLVGTAKYILWYHEGELTSFRTGAIVIECILGFLTFTGSLMAAGKLQEWIPTRPITYKNQNLYNLLLLAIAIAVGVLIIFKPNLWWLFPIVVILSLTFGVLLIIPIGGADMPTVISLLNSYAGLSAVAMGFVLENKLLITAGALDGSSGFILSVIMCRAMNRSFTNVLFGAFGQVAVKKEATGEQKAVKSTNSEEVAQILESANNVVVVPGYGMAVAQAQHAVAELASVLGKKGVNVKFAIHPVAGRMPGHMNVLLAEANVSYDSLYDLSINSEMDQCDVGLVIGANDVVNPAARHDKSSPIYGMPIIDIDKAKTVIICKRSMNPGFAGIENELFVKDNSLMLFGDAKQSIAAVVNALKGGGMH